MTNKLPDRRKTPLVNIATIIALIGLMISVIIATIEVTSSFNSLENRISELEEGQLTEDQAKEIAIASSQANWEQNELALKTEAALIDARDFIEGYIDLEQEMTMDEYIEHCHLNKTRVFKGGILLVTDEYGVRTTLEPQYSHNMLVDLVEKLRRFQN